MSKIDVSLIKSFRGDFASFSKEIEKKYGFKIELGNISYNDATFTGKLNASLLNDDGIKVIDPQHEARAKMDLLLAGWNMPKEQKIIGEKCLLSNGEEGVIKDFVSRCSVRPYVVESGRKTYKVTTSQLMSINGIKK